MWRWARFFHMTAMGGIDRESAAEPRVHYQASDGRTDMEYLLIVVFI